MKRTTVAAVLALACAGTVGCNMKKGETRRAEASRGAGAAKDRAVQRAGEIKEEVPVAVDSLDQEMRYEVSRIDPKTSEIVLVPAELAEGDIEPQAGQELRLSFGEFRVLSGKADPSAGDVIQSLEEGGEVIVYGKRMGIPTGADDIERIEFPDQENENELRK
jgi:hypothetical protein